MASGAPFPFSAPGTALLPRYEELKEEHEAGMGDGVGLVPQGIPLGATVVHLPTQQPQPQIYVASPPRDHLAWSLFTTIYMNFCCLGFMALVFSVKARDRKMIGDHSGAGSYGSTAKCLNVLALLLHLLGIVVLIILVSTGVIIITHLQL